MPMFIEILTQLHLVLASLTTVNRIHNQHIVVIKVVIPAIKQVAPPVSLELIELLIQILMLHIYNVYVKILMYN